MVKLEDYGETGDSVSLKVLDNEKFTIIEIEDSNYDDNGTTVDGVRITTKELFNGINQFHTTRIGIVKRLKDQKIRTDVNENGKPLGPLKITEDTSKNGKKFFKLIDA